MKNCVLGIFFVVIACLTAELYDTRKDLRESNTKFIEWKEDLDKVMAAAVRVQRDTKGMYMLCSRYKAGAEKYAYLNGTTFCFKVREIR